jgi:hypothetical protein
MVMHVTPGRCVRLPRLGSTLLPILEPGTTLIVLGTCRGQSTELEVPFIQNPIAIHSMMAGAGACRQHQINNDRSRLPLSWWYSRVQMAEARLE